MQGLTQPTLLKKIFAEDGDRNIIPVDNTDQDDPVADPSETQRADLTVGFPPITSKRPEDGGLPPERKDFNALGYLTTAYDYFYQAGGTFTFNATVSSAIGGYPQGARLWYTDGNGATTVLRSTKNDNTDNFVTTPSYIGTSWVQEIPVLGWDNTWTGNNTLVNKEIFLKRTDYELGVPPSSDIHFSIGTTDKNNLWFGGFEQHINSNGHIYKRISQRKQDGTDDYAILDIGYDSNGRDYAWGSAGVVASFDMWGMPNYSARTSYTKNTAVSSNGYVFISLRPSSDEMSWKISVNGTDIYHIRQRYRSKDTYVIPVKGGDKVDWSGSFDSNPELYFVPCVGG